MKGDLRGPSRSPIRKKGRRTAPAFSFLLADGMEGFIFAGTMYRLPVLVSALFILVQAGFVACVPHEPRAEVVDKFFSQERKDLLVIGHRGAKGLAPENTMAAFQVAADLGVPFELDTMLCKSGEPVVIHDYTVDRTTGGTGRVADLTLAELKALDAGSHFSEKFKNERIPTLAEVLDRFAGRVRIDVEIKYEGPGDQAHLTAEAVAKVIMDRGLTDRVFISAFNPYILEALRHAAPELARGQLYSHFDDTDLAFYKKIVLRNLLLNGKADPDFLAPHHELVDEDYVKEYNGLGYAVVPFTVNEPERIEELITWGVEGIITDFPQRVLDRR